MLWYNKIKYSRQIERMVLMEKTEMIEKEENILENEKGFNMMYNLTMVSAVATVAMFVIGTALYLTVVG